jgi:hypothetical protein
MLQQQCHTLDSEWFGGKKYAILNLLMGKPWKLMVISSVFYFLVSLVHVCAFFVSASRCSLFVVTQTSCVQYFICGVPLCTWTKFWMLTVTLVQ